MNPADREAFSVQDELNEPLDTEAADDLRAVLGFPPPVAPPTFRVTQADQPAPALDPGGPYRELEALIRPLVEKVAAMSDRLARLEDRYCDPSGLLEEVDRKLEKLLDAGRRVDRAAGSSPSSVRDVQLDDLRLQIHDLRVGMENMTKMLFG